MSRKWFTLAAFALVFLIVVSAAPALFAASAPKPITISFAVSGPNSQNDPKLVMAWELVKRVEKKSGGAIQFKWLGGPEVIPSSQQPEAVRTGALDSTWGPMTQAVTFIPEAGALVLSRLSSQEQKASGFYEMMQKIWEEKNIYYLMNIDSSKWDQNFRVFLKKTISKPEDLKGVKLRASGSFTPVVKAFEGVPVNVSSDDLYTALERGVVDGCVYPIDSIAKRGLNEVLKYYVTPGFGRSETVWIVNLKVWKSIPANLQKLITEEVNAIEKEYETKLISEVHQPWIDEIVKLGMKEIVLPGPAGERLAQAFYDAGWAAILKKSPDRGAKLRAVSGR